MATERRQSLTEEEKLRRSEEMRLMGFDSQMHPLSQRAWMDRTNANRDSTSFRKDYEIAENGEIKRSTQHHATQRAYFLKC